ncbi:MAG: hypothetical protein PVJ21_22115 [Anaerolineales bacterium]|jgi:hypothetical protein
MNMLRRLIGRIKLKSRGKNHIVGWDMTTEQAHAFFVFQMKTALTLFGFSSEYEDETAMLQKVRNILSGYSPETTLVNIGATSGGIGGAYPLAKSMGFTTTGIVSTLALDNVDQINEAVDHICFIADKQWGGRLPNSKYLSPTSKAMVACSDVLIAIGGGEVTRDELLAGKEQGKPVQFYPAEVKHEWAIRNAEKTGMPKPKFFWGEAYEIFGK